VRCTKKKKKTSRDEITPETLKTITYKMPKRRFSGVWRECGSLGFI